MKFYDEVRLTLLSRPQNWSINMGKMRNILSTDFEKYPETVKDTLKAW